MHIKDRGINQKNPHLIEFKKTVDTLADRIKKDPISYLRFLQFQKNSVKNYSFLSLLHDAAYLENQIDSSSQMHNFYEVIINGLIQDPDLRFEGDKKTPQKNRRGQLEVEEKKGQRKTIQQDLKLEQKSQHKSSINPENIGLEKTLKVFEFLEIFLEKYVIFK
jgi:hypothetical protein